jgi:hypothetical protein
MFKSFGTLVLACWLLPTVAAAQNGSLQIPEFPSLAAKAVDSVNIDIGPWLLHMAGTFVDDKDADSVHMKKILSQIHSIRMRSYQFASDNMYPAAEIDAVRKQLGTPGWTRLVETHERKDHKDVDIYVYIADHRTEGFALIASEPREFTILSITGSINVEDLAQLEHELHLPRVAPDAHEDVTEEAKSRAPH